MTETVRRWRRWGHTLEIGTSDRADSWRPAVRRSYDMATSYSGLKNEQASFHRIGPYK